MSFSNRGVNAYRNVDVSTSVPYADSVQLIQLLFNGLMTALADAEGHFERKDIAGKNAAISRATKIIVGLQGSLDFEKGQELARNLADLYDYCTRRLLKANLRNDVEGVLEVKGLLGEINGAWEILPMLLNDAPVAQAS